MYLALFFLCMFGALLLIIYSIKECTSYTVCLLCNAEVHKSEQISHDINRHAGMSNVKQTHMLVCLNREKCVCRIAEYEAVNLALMRRINGQVA